MNKTVILILTALVLLSCNNNESNGVAQYDYNVPSGQNFNIVVIDGCEYVVFTGYYKGGITHKGNCKNH